MSYQLKALALFVGMLVGAGMFGIPYATAQVGYVAGVCIILGVGLLSASTFLAFSHVIAQSNQTQQFSGYCETYLGRHAKWASFIALSVAIIGALVAYLSEISHLVSELLSIPDNRTLILTLALWSIFSAIVYSGTDIVASFEVVLLFFLITGTIILSLIGTFFVETSSFLVVPLEPDFFLPYGVILFAYGGIVALPEMWHILPTSKTQQRIFERVLIYGSILVTALYVLFTTVITGISRGNISESGVEGLQIALGMPGLVFGVLLAITTMSSSYIVASLSIARMIELDTSLKKRTAVLLTILSPIILLFAQNATFIEILGFVGAISSGISGILVWQMYKVTMQQKNATIPILPSVAQLFFVIALFYPVYVIL